MGYIEIHRPDGTIIYLGEPQPLHAAELIEICDMCNEPKPASDLKNMGVSATEAIWECSKCHARNKS